MAAMALSGKRVRLYDVLKVVGFAYLALYAQRSMALFAIAAAPVAARYLNVWWQDAAVTPLGVFVNSLQEGEVNKPLPKGFARLINLAVVSALLAACLYRAYQLSRPDIVHQSYPKAAVEWIESNQPEGRMLNTYNWGGYLTWALPSYPVFIDGRADLYGDELIQAWWRIVNAEAGASALLDSYEIQFVFLEPGWPIAEALSSQGWVSAYEDGQSLILRRP
jgi:hypothetical protein